MLNFKNILLSAIGIAIGSILTITFSDYFLSSDAISDLSEDVSTISEENYNDTNLPAYPNDPVVSYEDTIQRFAPLGVMIDSTGIGSRFLTSEEVTNLFETVDRNISTESYRFLLPEDFPDHLKDYANKAKERTIQRLLSQGNCTAEDFEDPGKVIIKIRLPVGPVEAVEVLQRVG